jgi:DNA-directed RNA polymerase subunit RPC12/RpoP
MDDFACRACGSPAVLYPNLLEENAPVVCDRCGSKVCSYGELRQRAEQMIKTSRDSAEVSGC